LILTWYLSMTNGQLDTWILSLDPNETAKALDNKRLMTQIFEGIQICASLIHKEKELVNPKSSTLKQLTTQLWRTYEYELLYLYLKPFCLEWQKRGFKWKGTINGRNIARLNKWMKSSTHRDVLKLPPWVTERVVESHRAEIIRRSPDEYAEKWLGTNVSIPFFYIEPEDEHKREFKLKTQIKLW